MAATIKDIARKLNISTSTVSYALNGGPRTVPDEVKERVLALARELEYRPNRIARSLVTGRTNTIGVVPPAVEQNAFLSPFVRSAWNGLVNAAAPLAQDLLLYTGHDRNRPDEPGQELLDGRIDGIVFIAPIPEAGAVRFVHERNFPFAIIAGSSEIARPTYTADNDAGVRLALEHLRDLGHHRVAHVTGSLGSSDAQVRLKAFRRHVQELGLDSDPALIVEGAFIIESGYRAGHHLMRLSEPPTAVFTANDEMAYGVCQAVRELGRSVPADLSVVGFDDTDLSFVFTPPITTVRQPVQEMAKAALRAAVAIVNGEGSPPSHIFPTELVVRGSTASPSRS
jgi:DNA-binding LacI/PurR family transcriptional regulator